MLPELLDQIPPASPPTVLALPINAELIPSAGARARAVAFRLQSHAHDAIEDEGQKADHGVGTDAIRQAVVDRHDLDVGFQYAEAALDVCEALVARDSLGRAQIRGVGDQRELSIKEFGLRDGVLIDRPAEPISIEIGLEKARKLGFRDSAGARIMRGRVLA